MSASVAATGSPTAAPAVAFSETERVALSPSVNSGGTLEVDPTWIPAAVADQGPFPTSLTARTCMSYRSPLVRPSRVYSRAPELQTSSSTVQLASDLSCTSLEMYRRS